MIPKHEALYPKEIQIIQEKIDILILKIVRGDDFDNTSFSTTKQLVNSFFGENMLFRCEYVNKIQQESSGKYRFTISKIDNLYI